MTLVYAARLDFKKQSTNIGAKKIQNIIKKKVNRKNLIRIRSK